MEPAEAPMKYIVHDVLVERVYEHKHQKWIGGVGKEATFEYVSMGWFVLLTGSHEALHVGHSEPNLKPGDLVRITIEREYYAKPSQAPV